MKQYIIVLSNYLTFDTGGWLRGPHSSLLAGETVGAARLIGLVTAEVKLNSHVVVSVTLVTAFLSLTHMVAMLRVWQTQTDT